MLLTSQETWLKCFLLMVGSLFYTSFAQAQDPLFSQFYLASTYLNPAYTGIDGGLTATMVDREQWGRVNSQSIVPGAFSSRMASVELMLNQKLGHAIGGVFMNDVEGDGLLKTNSAGLNYCYTLNGESKLRNNYSSLRLAIGFYYAQKSIDWNRLVFSDQLHPKGPDFFAPNSAHSIFYDEFAANPPWWGGANFGAVYNFIQKNSNNVNQQQFEVGFTLTHLLNLAGNVGIESLQGFDSRQVPRLTLSSRYFSRALRFGTKGNRLTFMPAGRLEYQADRERYFSGGISAFTLGGQLYIKNIGLGFYYHRTLSNSFGLSTDALIVAIDTEFLFGKNASLEIGMSYDINISGLSGLGGGVMELGIKYRKNTYAEGVHCPPVSRAHAERWENIFHKKQENKNVL